jgi:hypothetical protein
VGVHYDPDRICALVISWTTVRLLLMLSTHLDLATCQVDCVAAFVHSPLPQPVGYDKMSDEEKLHSCTYVEMPGGFRKEEKVVHLSKALHKLKSVPKAFFSHLKSNLEAMGFEQAIDIDPCLFISDKVMCLVCVNGTLLHAKNHDNADEVIQQLTK